MEDLKSRLRSIHSQRREHLNAIAMLDAMEAKLIGEPVGLRKTNGLSSRDTKALFAELQRRAR